MGTWCKSFTNSFHPYKGPPLRCDYADTGCPNMVKFVVRIRMKNPPKEIVEHCPYIEFHVCSKCKEYYKNHQTDQKYPKA